MSCAKVIIALTVPSHLIQEQTVDLSARHSFRCWEYSREKQTNIPAHVGLIYSGLREGREKTINKETRKKYSMSDGAKCYGGKQSREIQKGGQGRLLLSVARDGLMEKVRAET